MKNNVHSMSDIEGLEKMIDNYIEINKEVVTLYPNKKVKVLKLSEVQYLPYMELFVIRKENKIKIGSINTIVACLDWKIELNKSDTRYYDYFNKLLKEFGL